MKSALWLIIAASFLVCIVVIMVPKDSIEHDGTTVSKECDCLGATFWYGTKCIGFTHHCRTPQAVADTCEPMSCTQIMKTFWTNTTTQQSTTNSILLGSDIVVIIDVSNSMIGQKLTSAKNAAKNLILNVRDEDRVAIITFSDTPLLTHEFSRDKNDLANAIENISVRGGTAYLPPLQMAEELFMNISSQNTIRGIIFLSDGIPSDEPELILEESRTIAAQNISMFTISFGIEDDNILQRMSSGDNAAANRRYKSYTTTESITDAFLEAYQELTTLNVIHIRPDFTEDEFTVNDLAGISFSTSINSTLISAVPSTTHQCLQGLTTTLSARTANSTTNITLIPQPNGFSLPPQSLAQGNYSLFITSQISMNNDEQQCTFIGTTLISPILVHEYESCQPASCQEVKELLGNQGLMTSHNILVPRTITSSHVALFIDQSESMESYAQDALHYAQLIDNMLSPDDYRTLVHFSDSAEMITPFTNEKIFNDATPAITKGTTLLLPAVKKMNNIFSTINGTKNVFIISDGQFYDHEQKEQILGAIRNIASNGICLTFIGLGNQLLINSTFITQAGEAAQTVGCGGYLHTPSEEELLAYMTKLYKGDYDTNSLLFIDSSVTTTGLEARIASTRTGLLLPLRTSKTCVEPPALEVRIELDGEDTPLVQKSITANYLGFYHYDFPTLPPGKYSLTMQAQLSNCTAQTQQEEFIITGSTKESPRTLSILLIFLFIGLLISVYEFFKKNKSPKT